MEGKLQGYPGQDLAIMAGPLTLWSQILIDEKDFVVQENDWSCGAAVFLMTQKAFQNIGTDFEEAIRLTGANKESGASNENMLNAFLTFEKDCEVKSACGADIETLRTLLREGYLVTINFREPKDGEGHYAIVQGISESFLQLADPWYGRESILSLEDFDFRSGFSSSIIEGWYIAVRHKCTGKVLTT